ncbi:MAG: ABC transporter ATP-binding protein [Candidatus Aerophobetes bacterium]
MVETNENLMQVKDLKKYFPLRGGFFSRVAEEIRAVDGVSFSIKPTETLGLVGESGSGKSTVARAILRLSSITDGQVLFEGGDIFKLNREKLRKLRRRLQIIFQDPHASLNPRMSVEEIVGEGIVIHRLARGPEKTEKVVRLLEVVGLSAHYLRRYPHEFSGGERQRIGIARALSVDPRLIVCDEPVSALDVSIQAQIINLLKDLQRMFGLSYLFIAHDLNVVRHIAHRVAVMYLGKIVELTSRDRVYTSPQHPYTEALLSAVPIPDPTVDRHRIVLKGEMPSPVNPPSGCYFHPRCPYAEPICRQKSPELKDLGRQHWVSCHLRKKAGYETNSSKGGKNQ